MFLILFISLITFVLVTSMMAYKHREVFLNPKAVGVTCISKKTLLLDDLEMESDFFVKDYFYKTYDVYITDKNDTPKKFFVRCDAKECDSATSIKQPLNNYEDAFLRHYETSHDNYFYITERFLEREHQALNIIIESRLQVPMDQTMNSMIFHELVKTNPITIKIEANERAKDMYDLFACNWNDSIKQATCQSVVWKSDGSVIIESRPDLNIDLLRFKPRRKRIGEFSTQNPLS